MAYITKKSEKGVKKMPKTSVNIMTTFTKKPANTVTLEDLTKAIRNSIDRAGMLEDEAKSMAQHVMNFFGYNERIIDNVLEPEDRDAFYILEDSGLLTTEREETTLYDGREWRIHYWLFRKEKIMEFVNSTRSEKVMNLQEAQMVYDDVPEDIWATRSSSEDKKDDSREGSVPTPSEMRRIRTNK